MQQIPFARLTESELQKIKDVEKFLNNQPDHRASRDEGKEIILLAYTYDHGDSK